MLNTRAPFSTIRGLSEADAQARLRTEGYNELPRPDRRTPLRIVLEVLREPMLALLLGGGAIYLILGDLKEALILLAFATMSVVITVVQETRTERVLEALRDLTSPRALVIRDGARKRIAGREVVRGDFVVLAEGDRVPADALIVQSHDLKTDKSLLTGESVPVRKIADGSAPGQDHRPGGDDLPYVFSGSLVVRGAGMGEVIATGALSEIGKIGQSLATLETEPPRLQAQTRRLVRVFAVIGGAVSVLAVLLYGTLRGGWLDAMLAGIALRMSMLPAEVPVVLTVFMAMGAWRVDCRKLLALWKGFLSAQRPYPGRSVDRMVPNDEADADWSDVQIQGGDPCGVRHRRYHARDAGNRLLFQGGPGVEHVRRTGRSRHQGCRHLLRIMERMVTQLIVAYRRRFALPAGEVSGLNSVRAW